MRELLAADLAAYGFTWRKALWRLFTLDTFWLVVLYRLARRLELAGVPTLPHTLKALGVLIWSADVQPSADIGGGFRIHHSPGLVIGPVVAGERLAVYQNVTLGGNGSPLQFPTIGDDVRVFAGAVVVGGITVGDRATIGANTVVRQDVEAGGVVHTGSSPR